MTDHENYLLKAILLISSVLDSLVTLVYATADGVNRFRGTPRFGCILPLMNSIRMRRRSLFEGAPLPPFRDFGTWETRLFLNCKPSGAKVPSSQFAGMRYSCVLSWN